MKKTPKILAAGGIVWRKRWRSQYVAVIHRKRYDDWTLPKGKVEPGEIIERAALREVEEETFCRVKLLEFAGQTSYVARDVNGQEVEKEVYYWNMRVRRKGRFKPNDEISQLLWLSPEDALNKLTYEHDRQLLRDSLHSSST
jgi:8-oxo-dGTP diphosphatase